MYYTNNTSCAIWKLVIDMFPYHSEYTGMYFLKTGTFSYVANKTANKSGNWQWYITTIWYSVFNTSISNIHYSKKKKKALIHMLYFSGHVFLVSFNLEQFLNHFLIFVTLILLKISHHLFAIMNLSLGLSDASSWFTSAGCTFFSRISQK